MYKYDKEYDRIIDRKSNCSGGQKYTVQVIAGSDISFLNISRLYSSMFFDDNAEVNHTQTCFTQAEIDDLKQQPDLAIDWDKAIITPVGEDD